MAGKTCKQCGSTTNEFARHKLTRDGLQNTCKPCKAVIDRGYYALNAERIKARQRARAKVMREDEVLTVRRRAEIEERKRVKMLQRAIAREWRRQEQIAKALQAGLAGDTDSDARMPDVSGIYCIRNCATGYRYIGSAVNMRKRARMHSVELDLGQHANDYLQKAWRKWGRAAFAFSVLEVVSDRALLVDREQFYINRFGSSDRLLGYNLAPNAESKLGYKPRPESVAGTRAGLLGRQLSDERKAKNRAWWNSLPPEERAKQIDKRRAGIRAAWATKSAEERAAVGQRISQALLSRTSQHREEAR